MFIRTIAAIALTGVLMLTPVTHAQHLSADGGVQTFNYLADQYFSDVYFHFGPTNGTAAGLHQYDTQLEDYSAANIQKEIAALHSYEKKVEAIDPSALDASVAGEREKLMPQVLLESCKNLKNPPKIYTEIALEQIDDLVSFFQNDVPAAFTEA